MRKRKTEIKWPKKAVIIDTRNRTIAYSIPFTWDLSKVKSEIIQGSLFYDRVIVGGPAVKLIPGYFNDLSFVEKIDDWQGALQKVNPYATRTTTGCPNACGFCAVPKIEGKFRELDNWPDLPVITDSNLLAASENHFSEVIRKLKKWSYPDFNQGLDCRRLNDFHAKGLSKLNHPTIRLSLDSFDQLDDWLRALNLLHKAGIPKMCIRSYALVGYSSSPKEAWDRCEFIEKNGVKVSPMWYHTLDAMKCNEVTEEQKNLGWTNYERKKIMSFFYKHKNVKEEKEVYN